MSIYFIREASSGLVKIGYAKNVERRRAALQIGIPGEITTIRVVDGDRISEEWLHARFAHLRVRGEWFEFSEEMMAVELTHDSVFMSKRTNNILQIRTALGLSQAEFAEEIGVSQGSVSNYECGRHIPQPDVASRIIHAAAERGHKVTFNDIYDVHAPASSISASSTIETPNENHC